MSNEWPKKSEPPELAADAAHVWSVPLDAEPRLVGMLSGLLSAEERQRAARFRVEDPRRRFVVARANLRRILGAYLEIPPGHVAFDYDANDKPHLARTPASGELRFNLAHSGELALVAVTRGCEVGVDVERLRDVNLWREIAERYFHPREIAEIAALAPSEHIAGFMRCWTAKEAVLKALGVGITRPLDFFVGSALPGEGAWIELQHAGASTRCHLRPLAPGGGYEGAVATVDAARMPQCFALA